MRNGLALVLTLVALSAVPSAAHAEYWFTQRGAERIARNDAENRYGDLYGIEYESSAASCRPQGERRADSRYKYHRWSCGWAGENYDGDICGGVLLIVGSRERGAYYSRVVRGTDC